MHRSLGFTFSAALILLVACGDDDGPATDGGTSDAEVPSTFRARFEPVTDPMPWGVAPFPDDLYLADDGTIALGTYPSEALSGFPRYVESLRDTLGELDGFGITSPVYFPVDGDVDPASLPDDGDSLLPEASVFLLDADPASPTAFQRVPIQARWEIGRAHV